MSEFDRTEQQRRLVDALARSVEMNDNGADRAKREAEARHAAAQQVLADMDVAREEHAKAEKRHAETLAQSGRTLAAELGAVSAAHAAGKAGIQAFIEALSHYAGTIAAEGEALASAGLPLEDLGGGYGIGGARDIVMLPGGVVHKQPSALVGLQLSQRLVAKVVAARFPGELGRQLIGAHSILETLWGTIVAALDEPVAVIPDVVTPVAAQLHDLDGGTFGDVPALLAELSPPIVGGHQADNPNRVRIQRVRPTNG